MVWSDGTFKNSDCFNYETLARACVEPGPAMFFSTRSNTNNHFPESSSGEIKLPSEAMNLKANCNDSSSSLSSPTTPWLSLRLVPAVEAKLSLTLTKPPEPPKITLAFGIGGLAIQLLSEWLTDWRRKDSVTQVSSDASSRRSPRILILLSRRKPQQMRGVIRVLNEKSRGSTKIVYGQIDYTKAHNINGSTSSSCVDSRNSEGSMRAVVVDALKTALGVSDKESEVSPNPTTIEFNESLPKPIAKLKNNSKSFTQHAPKERIAPKIQGGDKEFFEIYASKVDEVYFFGGALDQMRPSQTLDIESELCDCSVVRAAESVVNMFSLNSSINSESSETSSALKLQLTLFSSLAGVCGASKALKYAGTAAALEALAANTNSNSNSNSDSNSNFSNFKCKSIALSAISDVGIAKQNPAFAAVAPSLGMQVLDGKRAVNLITGIRKFLTTEPNSNCNYLVGFNPSHRITKVLMGLKNSETEVTTPIDSNSNGASSDSLNPTVLRLLPIIQKAAGMPHLDPTNSFFNQGMHSLQVIRVARQLSLGLGLDVPVQILFEKSSVCELGEWLDSEEGSGDSKEKTDTEAEKADSDLREKNELVAKIEEMGIFISSSPKGVVKGDSDSNTDTDTVTGGDLKSMAEKATEIFDSKLNPPKVINSLSESSDSNKSPISLDLNTLLILVDVHLAAKTNPQKALEILDFINEKCRNALSGVMKILVEGKRKRVQALIKTGRELTAQELLDDFLTNKEQLFTRYVENQTASNGTTVDSESMPIIKSLDLRGQPAEQVLRTLQTNSSLSTTLIHSLRELNISSCGIPYKKSDLVVSDSNTIDCLSLCKNLAVVSAGGNRFEVVPKCFRYSEFGVSLRVLDLSCQKDPYLTVSGAVDFRHLEELVMVGCRFENSSTVGSEEETNSKLNLKFGPSLKKLKISEPAIHDSTSLFDLSWLNHSPNIEELDLSGRKFYADTNTSGSQSLPSLSRLKSLFLRSCCLANNISTFFGPSSSFPKLTHLYLQGNSLGPYLDPTLFSKTTFPVLRQLEMQQNPLLKRLPIGGLKTLGGSLRVLYAQGNDLEGEEEGDNIRSLVGCCPLLQYLGVGGNSKLRFSQDPDDSNIIKSLSRDGEIQLGVGWIDRNRNDITTNKSMSIIPRLDAFCSNTDIRIDMGNFNNLPIPNCPNRNFQNRLIVIILSPQGPPVANATALRESLKSTGKTQLLSEIDFIYVCDPANSFYLRDPGGGWGGIGYFESRIRGAIEEVKSKRRGKSNSNSTMGGALVNNDFHPESRTLTSSDRDSTEFKRRKVDSNVNSFKTLLLGSSMGASAALLFAHLADRTVAFSPETDLDLSHGQHFPGAGANLNVKKAFREKIEENWTNLNNLNLNNNLLKRPRICVHVGRFSELDMMHVDRLDLRLGNAEIITHEFSRHNVLLFLDKRGLMVPLLVREMEALLEL